MNKQNNAKLFWFCQLTGWGLFTLFNLTVRGYFSHFSIGELVNSTTLFVGFVVSTTLLRRYLKSQLTTKSPLKNAGHVFVASIASALLTEFIVLIVIVPNHQLLFGEPMTNMWQQVLMSLPNLIIFTLLWATLYVMIRRQKLLTASLAEALQLQSSLKASQLDVLLNQLNPHFVFNAINNIRALILEDTEKARACLADLSEVMRTTMQVKQDKMWSFEQELHLVESYLALNQLQFEQRLTIKKSIGSDVSHQSFPCMMLQLLVENAIKHGVGKLAEGGLIEISTKMAGSVFTVSVLNTGKLITGDDEFGVGVSNIHSRLKLLFADRAHFELKQQQDKVQAKITINTKE